jgi:hypothetical protein
MSAAAPGILELHFVFAVMRDQPCNPKIQKTRLRSEHVEAHFSKFTKLEIQSSVHNDEACDQPLSPNTTQDISSPKSKQTKRSSAEA